MNGFHKLPAKVPQLVLAGLAIGLCVWAGRGSYGAGQASLLAWASRAQVAAREKQDAGNTAESARRAAPNSPEAALALGNALQARQDYAGAEAALLQALTLRPKDYFLWLELGRMRDSRNEPEKALQALRRAAELAPYYADVRWQMGNVLLRAGDTAAGWANLREAALQDSTYWPVLLNLAWPWHDKQVAALEQTLKPEGAAANWAFALFYARHQQPDAALQSFRKLPAAREAQRQALQNLLLSNFHYGVARELWWQGPGQNYRGAPISNQGFEDELVNDPQGFSWRVWDSNPKLLHSTLDSREHKEGRYSLRLDYSGEVPASTGLLSQIIAVRPGAGYSLSFAVKTDALVSTGTPFVGLVRTTATGKQLVAQSEPLETGTKDWRKYEISFAARDADALAIEVQRTCQTAPCPIFGKVWWDDFVLRETSGKR